MLCGPDWGMGIGKGNGAFKRLARKKRRLFGRDRDYDSRRIGHAVLRCGHSTGVVHGRRW